MRYGIFCIRNFLLCDCHWFKYYILYWTNFIFIFNPFNSWNYNFACKRYNINIWRKKVWKVLLWSFIFLKLCFPKYNQVTIFISHSDTMASEKYKLGSYNSVSNVNYKMDNQVYSFQYMLYIVNNLENSCTNSWNWWN